MLVRSEKYPSLMVMDIGIQFKDGEAEVTDPAHIKRLRKLKHRGVVVVDEGDAEDAKPRPDAGSEVETKPSEGDTKPESGEVETSKPDEAKSEEVKGEQPKSEETKGQEPAPEPEPKPKPTRARKTDKPFG